MFQSDYTPEELAKKCPIGAVALSIASITSKIESIGLSAFGTMMFEKYLSNAPSSKSQFPSTEAMTEHSDAIVKTLLFAIKANAKQQAGLRKKVVDLGSAHASKWAVKNADYENLTDALYKIVDESEESFTETEVEIIVKAWSQINDWLAEGAEHAAKQPAVIPQAPPSNGSEYNATHGAGSVSGLSPRSIAKPNQPLHEQPLNDSEIHMVESTWAEVLPLGYEAVGRYLYQQMFALRPEFLQLFSFRMEKDMYFSTKFKHHTSRVVRAVNNAVTNIRRWHITMVPIFEALGETHLHYKVKPEDFPVVGDCIINIMKANLKDKFTPSHEAAWKKFYSKIDWALQVGLKRAIDQVSNKGGLEAAIAGEAAGEKEKTFDENGEEITDDESMTEQDIQDVQHSWDLAKKIGAETIGKLLYQRMFELRPELLSLFSFKDEHDMFSNPVFINHSTRVVITVGNAVINIRRRESILRNLEKLGEKHVDYKVKPAHFPVVGEALLHVLDKGLGAQVMTPKTRRAWHKTYQLVSGAMIRGLKSELAKRRATGELTDEEQKYWEDV